VNHVSLAHTYAHILAKKALGHVESAYGALNMKNDLDFAEKLQSIMVAAQTEEGQSLFVKTMKNPNMVLGGMIKGLNLQKPSREYVNTLSALVHAKPEDFAEPVENIQNIRAMAFMSLADAASKLHQHDREMSEKIVLDVTDSLAHADSLHHLMTSIHALGNAGDAAPLSVLRQVIESEHLPLEAKLAGVQGLSKRSSEDTEEETTDYIHTLVREHPEEVVRSAAVMAQLDRERERSTHASVEEFTQALEHEQSPAVQRAIVHYLTHTLALDVDENDDGTASLEVVEGKDDNEKTNSLWERLKNKLNINTATFDTAQAVCINSAKGKVKNMCTKSAGNGQFIFELAKKYKPDQNYDRSKFTIEEEISGIGIAHQVKTNLHYFGTNTAGTSYLEVDRYERYWSVFSNQMNIMTQEVYVSKTNGKRSIHLYIKVRNTVLINTSPKNEKSYICFEIKGSLFKHQWKPMASIGFHVMAGPVPLKFEIGVSSSLEITLALTVCDSEKKFGIAIEGTVETKLGVAGGASLSIVVAKVGLEIELSTGVKATLTGGFVTPLACLETKLTLSPFAIAINAVGSLLWFTRKKELWKYEPMVSYYEKQVEEDPIWIKKKSDLIAKKGPDVGGKAYDEQAAKEVEIRVAKKSDLLRLCKCWDFRIEDDDKMAVACPTLPFKMPGDPIKLEFDKEFDWGEIGKAKE